MRPLILLLTFSTVLQAQDALPPEKLTLIKRATVLVNCENGETGCTGSGFLIRVDGNSGYLATNNHVIDLRTDKTLRRTTRNEAVEVVFDSGQIGERVVRAEVIAADPDRDLAILKVQNVKALPAPIPVLAGIPLTETTPVLACGFPFGGSLATSRKFPAVTISSSRVSSVRTNDAGQVTEVQLDGSALNPGNSGGPVVTMKGQLAGVAVAGIPGSGIGFAIPCAELIKLINGRACKPAVYASPVDSNTVQFRVEGVLLDPFQRIKSVSVHHRTAKSGDRPPHPDISGRWNGLSNAGVDCVVKDGLATGTIRVPKGANSIWLQFEYRTPDGLIYDEPVEMKFPSFNGSGGRYLNQVRNERGGIVLAGPKGTVSLKDLNRDASNYLGKQVSVDGVLTGTRPGDDRIDFAIGFDKSSRPQNICFLGSASLADQVKESLASGPKSVRVVGSVLAATRPNGPFVIDVEELNILGDDGAIAASYKPLSSISPKAVVAEKPTPESMPAPVAEPQAEAPAEKLPVGTLIAAGAALAVGLCVAGFVAVKRRGSAKSAPQAPTRTVSERLNRRVR